MRSHSLPPSFTPSDVWCAVQSGSVLALGAAISQIEESTTSAAELLALAATSTHHANVVGFTGPPGAGKSTLVSALVSVARAAGDRVAVVAVDPSSPWTGGALLGDRIRMVEHAGDHGVYVRSMASRGTPGGLSQTTAAVARFLAASFDRVYVETVGVGQTELAIALEADTTVVVINPGLGDAVQADKAGIFEAADIFVINKADRPGALACEQELQMMLELTSVEGGWTAPIVKTEATSSRGLEELDAAIARHARHVAEDRRTRRGVLDVSLVESALTLAFRNELRRYLETEEGLRQLRDDTTSAEDIVRLITAAMMNGKE